MNVRHEAYQRYPKSLDTQVRFKYFSFGSMVNRIGRDPSFSHLSVYAYVPRPAIFDIRPVTHYACPPLRSKPLFAQCSGNPNEKEHWETPTSNNYIDGKRKQKGKDQTKQWIQNRSRTIRGKRQSKESC